MEFPIEKEIDSFKMYIVGFTINEKMYSNFNMFYYKCIYAWEYL